MLLLRSAALLATLSAPAAEKVDAFWYETVSPHFQVRHEAAFLPPGFSLVLEKIHNRLRMDLSMFSPWMVKERVKLYLYAGRKSYVAGEFKPPAWSNGIAFHQQKLVAVYNQPSAEKLREIVAHETAHLLFEGYWWERGKPPPQWLNEGLSMMEETEDPLVPEKSEWFQTMLMLKPDKIVPIAKFMEIRPTSDLQDKDRESVSMWYLQAFSLVHFLYREHSRMQFLNFCARLRDGKELEAAVWEVYRYRGVPELERAWRAWLAKPSTVARMRKFLKYSASAARDEEDASKDKPGRLKRSTGFKSFDYHTIQQQK